MHILRHTFSTRCIEAGMKPKTLQMLLGHSNIGITMNLYVHTTEEEKKKEADPQMEVIYQQLEERIKSIVGTKVAIQHKNKNKGKIEIEYYSQAELERLIDLFESIKES